MATKDVYLAYSLTGITDLYLYPAEEEDFTNWATARINLVETSAGTKLYKATVDTAKTWHLFSGVATPADFDAAIGYVPDLLDTSSITVDALTDAQNAKLMTGTGATQQQIRDAMKLAPSAGAPATGSVDQHLDDASTFDNTTDTVIVGTINSDVITSTSIAASALDGKGDWAAASNYTATRAGFLDNIGIGGPVASQASVNNLSTAVRNKVIVPGEYQLPSSGDERWKIVVYLYKSDNTGLEDADSNTVTVTVENQAGTDRSGNLFDASSGGSATQTMNRVAQGHYELWYEIGATDAVEQLIYDVDYDVSSAAQKGSGTTVVVDVVSSGGFNSTDRSNLDALFNDWTPSGRLDLVLAARSSHDAAAVVTALKADAQWSDLTVIDANIDAIEPIIVTQLADTLENDGGTYRFTTNALEQAPTGSGGTPTGGGNSRDPF